MGFFCVLVKSALIRKKTSKGCHIQSLWLWWKYSKLHKWVWHGEMRKKIPLSHTVEDDEFMNDTLEDMICEIGVDAFKKANVVDTLQIDM